MKNTSPLLVKFHFRPIKFRKFWYREQYPLRLRNSVSLQGRLSQGSSCVEELGIFLACLKRHDFDDAFCDMEFTRYTGCVQESRLAQANMKAAAKEGLLGSEGRVLTTAQVNNLLQQWPQEGCLKNRANKRPPWMSYAYPNYLERGREGKLNRSDRDGERREVKDEIKQINDNDVFTHF